ncbi:MAG: site-specific DNA-methyltransferase, partial [Thermodesulfobacteriota bacterium]|nr:site-specific DNA-methyltransferase [Thermodesulfobacteriota bacterium]
MPTKEQQRQKLIALLKKLFQLDQPDLDFGFYRIMHAKAEQITEFLDKDLLDVIEDAFGMVDENKKERLKTEYEQELKTAREYGAADPENSPKVQEARENYESALLTEDGEGEIYDHLYRFFERYYDNGDFISRRYYTRETSGKAAPFAIPYNGEEVKLVWANMDQYYIKTSEYFTNYTFDIMQAKEIQALQKEDSLGLFKGTDEKPRRVHFRVVDAAEGEHGNVKISESEKRFFIIYKENPAFLDDNGELVVNFEYRPDPEKGSSQEGTWRERRNTEAVETVIKALDNLNGAKEYRTLLKIPAPTEKRKDRPLLAKYINQYTARNTMDYFIHKELGNFMRRELDFYIKNEVMRLDDIENAAAPAVETYFAKLKVLRKIAGKLIDFLAQLEDFQKKLWLKKKFVVDTNYCITLDRVPEELYPEILANDAQHEEWVRLFAIDKIEGDLTLPAYSAPLTVEFLKSNPFLVLDTKFFPEDFKARLTASIEDFDEQCDGLLIHSENFQALHPLKVRYREQVKCVYIDPPYNTEKDRSEGRFLYKNSFSSSSWICMMENRYQALISLLADTGVLFSSIGEEENKSLDFLLSQIFGNENKISIATREMKKGANRGTHFSPAIDYVSAYAKNKEFLKPFFEPFSQAYIASFRMDDNDNRGKYKTTNLYEPTLDYYENCRYPIECPDGSIVITPEKKSFSHNKESFQELLIDNKIVFSKGKSSKLQTIDGNKTFWTVKRKIYLSDMEEKGRRPSDLILNLINGNGTKEMTALGMQFSFAKPVALIKYLIKIINFRDSYILDYFAGSGTTGHAVININREDGGKRKYILVEMGDYFDTVLKPRISKVVYSENWKDGKPMSRNTGISHCFKCIRLESYEDALNNLRFDKNETRDAAIAGNSDLREDYMLHYLLDVETRGSQSLLNIDSFADPTAYTLKIKKPGSDEHVVRNVDLIETFNYLIGLRVTYIDSPQSFTARFKRETDPDIPEDQ